MKRDLSLWQFAGFVVTALGGTLLHFLYEKTSQSIAVAPFSAVNESTWEHMKLLFIPMFIFSLIQARFFKGENRFWCIKLTGISLGLVLIPVLFYTSNGAFGKTPDWVNITIFFVSAAIAYIWETHLFKQDHMQCRFFRLAFLLICLISALFIVFTFVPPHIPLFRDPSSGTYGVV